MIVEIIVAIVAISIVALVFGKFLYKFLRNEPTGECACCKNKMKRAIKKAKKDLSKNHKQ